MKLSYRDKVILLVFIIIAIFAVGIIFLIKPKYDEIGVNRQTLAAKELEREDINSQIAALPDMKKNLQNLYDGGVEISEKFIPHMQTFEIDQYVYDILNANNIEWNSLSITPMTTTSLQFYTYYDPMFTYPLYVASDLVGELPESVVTGIPETPNTPTPQMIPMSTVTFDFYTSKNNFKVFLDRVYSLDKTVILNSVSVSEYDTDDVQGSIVMNIYFINPLSELPED